MKHYDLQPKARSHFSEHNFHTISVPICSCLLFPVSNSLPEQRESNHVPVQILHVYKLPRMHTKPKRTENYKYRAEVKGSMHWHTTRSLQHKNSKMESLSIVASKMHPDKANDLLWNPQRPTTCSSNWMLFYATPLGSKATKV